MTNEHIVNCPVDAVDRGAAEKTDKCVQQIEGDIIHVVMRRNRKAKLQLARQLLAQGLDRASIERILNINVSELI